jgi:hypothetical protein
VVVSVTLTVGFVEEPAVGRVVVSSLFCTELIPAVTHTAATRSESIIAIIFVLLAIFIILLFKKS